MLRDREYKNLFKFQKGTNRIKSRESTRLEFKESFNWNSRDKYAKTIAAFANNRGGIIVFGVKNTPRELVGLTSDKFENLDEARITEYFNSVFSPTLEFEKTMIEINKKEIGFLEVNEAAIKPVICIKNDNSLKESEIYYRYNGRTEKIKYPELLNIINKIRENEGLKWKELLRKIARIDLSSLEIDIDEGMIKGPQTSYLRITHDPRAPEVRVKEEDILKNYIDYKSLLDMLADRYNNFKQNKNFHAIKRRLRNDPSSHYCKVRLLDPNNPNSTNKVYYHPDIVKEFDKHYKIK